jgi:hypothetical protein
MFPVRFHCRNDHRFKPVPVAVNDYPKPKKDDIEKRENIKARHESGGSANDGEDDEKRTDDLNELDEPGISDDVGNRQNLYPDKERQQSAADS